MSGGITIAYTSLPALGQTNKAGSLPVTLASDQDALPVSLASVPSHPVTNAGTFAVQSTPVTQADTFMLGGVNIKEINGVTPLMGSGIMGTGSLRVTLASDNDALTIKQATGTNLHAVLDANSGVDIGKLTANQSVNIAQLAGTTTDTNSGSKSAGTLRVVLATDQPALTNKLLVTPDSVALPANQSVNVSQVNGVTTLMGNGVTGTGSQRVTIASDNTAFSVNPSIAVIPTATTLQNGATASGNGTSLNVSGYATAVLNITASVAMSGGTTINFEASVDDTTWVSIYGDPTSAITNPAITTTATGDWTFSVSGYKSLRARISAYSAGTITVKGYTSFTTDTPIFTAANLLLNGTTVDGNSGSKSAGTIRVVLATDQPALTNKLLVTPDSVALPANQSVNAAQVGGTATDTNSGSKSAGTLRVVLATDQPALTNKLLVTPDSVALPANQSVNNSQINGVTPLMGNGITGTGSQRVTISSDNTPFPVKTDQTTHGTTDLVAADVTKIAGTAIVNGGTAGTQSVGGMVANNGTINSAVNPVLIGGQAVSSENAANTTAKLSQLVTDLVGKLIVLPYANPENFVSGAITSAMTGTTSTSLMAAPASGLRNYITQITVSNSHATVGTDVIIQDGSGGTTLYTIPAAAVYGGAAITFPTPLRQPTTATAIYCANVTTGASVKVSVSGYKGI